MQITRFLYFMLPFQIMLASEKDNLLVETKNRKNKNGSNFLNYCIITPLAYGTAAYTGTKGTEYFANAEYNTDYDLHSKKISLAATGIVFARNFYKWYKHNEKNSIVKTEPQGRTFATFLSSCIITPIAFAAIAYTGTKGTEFTVNRKYDTDHDLHPKKISLATAGIIFACNFYKWLDIYPNEEISKDVNKMNKLNEKNIEDLRKLSTTHFEERKSTLNSLLVNLQTNQVTQLFEIKKIGDSLTERLDDCIKQASSQSEQLDDMSVLIERQEDIIEKIAQKIDNHAEDIHLITSEVNNHNSNVLGVKNNLIDVNQRIAILSQKIDDALKSSIKN